MRRSMRIMVPMAALAVAMTAVVLPAGTATAGDPPALLRSGLVGSSKAPVGPTLFGVLPGGAPWVVDSGRVRVDRSGRLELRVEGLVIPTAPFNGTNPVPTLSVSVFCNGVSADTSGTVPFSTEGDAEVEADLDLPSPCLAPAVLVHPVTFTGVYIAANG